MYRLSRYRYLEFNHNSRGSTRPASQIPSIFTMFASTTPFKIANDENQNSVFKTTKGGRGGLQQTTTAGKGGLSVFNESTNKIPIGSAMKSTRKALTDVTNSTIHANNQTAVRGGKTQLADNSATLGLNKPIMVQFKISEKPTSSEVKQAKIQSTVLKGADWKDMVRDVAVNLVGLTVMDTDHHSPAFIHVYLLFTSLYRMI